MSFNVLLDNNVVGSFKPSSKGFTTLTTNTFELRSGNHTLSFIGTASQTDASSFIDRVLLNAIKDSDSINTILFGTKCASGTTCKFSDAAEATTVSAACADGIMNVQSSTYGFGNNTRSCLSYAAGACNGKSSCTLTFSNGNCGGDPLPGVSKFGDMVVSCGAGGTTAPVKGCTPRGTFNPANPQESGFQSTFVDDFGSAATIDVGATGNPGFKWYTKPFFGGSPTPATELSVSGGVLTISPGASETGNWQIATASLASNSQGFVGNVFGNGGYFEASIKFNPDKIPNLASNPSQKDLSKGWPSFWSLAIEHATHNQTNADQWPGQVNGYQHYIEVDFFEFDTNWAWDRTYGGAIHDWYGVFLKTCPGSVCQVVNGGAGTKFNNLVVDPDKRTLTNGKIDWNRWHKYGLLWVKADASNGYKGYVQYYFDGYPTNDYVSWSAPPNGFGPGGVAPSQLPNSSYAFSILDTQRLMVILGSGAYQPMSVDDVRVWQLPNCR